MGRELKRESPFRRAARRDLREKNGARRLTASRADKHVLYERSVQDTDHELGVVERIFKRMTGRTALSMREDFCGTALFCAEWVKSRRDRTAMGVDLDPAVLAWGRKNRIGPLGETGDRVSLRRANVLSPPPGRFDIVVAFNYSYFVFKTRRELGEYFKKARASLAPDGVFFLDAYGGWDAQREVTETRREDGFTYVWEQAYFNPIDNHVVNHITFRFQDGSEMKRAFTYDWRLWQLIEIRELLLEVGFAEAHTYWEDTGSDGEGTGVFRLREKAECDPGWNAYIVALKQKPRRR